MTSASRTTQPSCCESCCARPSTASPLRSTSTATTSGALAAQVGGIGIAPGANINYVTGHAVFEVNRGASPLRRSALRQGQDDLCEQIAAERDDQVRDADRVSSRRKG